MTREALYALLFARVTALVGHGLVTTSRRLEFVEEVAVERLPGVWQLQVDETLAGSTLGGMAIINADVDWYVYASAPDESQPSTPILNPAVDLVMGLIPHAGDADNTLFRDPDGNVIQLTLRGPVKYYEGLLGNKAVCCIPLRMMVPGSLGT